LPPGAAPEVDDQGANGREVARCQGLDVVPAGVGEVGIGGAEWPTKPARAPAGPTVDCCGTVNRVVFDLKPALGVIPDGGAEGVMITEADEMGGFAHWVDGDGKLHRTYSTMAVHQYRQVSTQPLPTGEVSVRMQFVAGKPRPGTGGTVSVWANGQQIGDGRMERGLRPHPAADALLQCSSRP